MSLEVPTLHLNVQFEDISSRTVGETVAGANAIPELAASCAPDIGHVSCTGGYEGCPGGTGDQPEEDPVVMECENG